MSFYKDNNECRLFRNDYEAAEAYGPGGTYAVKFENILNPTATSYGSTYEKFETLGDGTYKVTRVDASTYGWEYGVLFTKSTATNIVVQGHKYYFQIDAYVSRIPTSSTSIAAECYYNGQWCTVGLPTAVDEWQTLSTIQEYTSTPQEAQQRSRILVWHYMTDAQGFQDGDYYMVRRPLFIDLTEAFGAGNEPTTKTELYEAIPQLADGGYYPPADATNREVTYIPTTHKTSYWIGEDCDVHFNQQVPITAASSTYTTNNGDGSFTCTGNEYYVLTTSFSRVVGHKYLFYCQGGESGRVYLRIDKTGGDAVTTETQTIVTMPDGASSNMYIRSFNLTEGESITITPMLFDLTEMFGEGYEPTTVEEFTRMYTDTYYPYTASLIIPSTSNYNTTYKNRDGVTFNQLFTIPTTASSTVEGVTFTNNNDGSITLNGTVTAETDTAYWQLQSSAASRIIKGHKYLFPDQEMYKIYIRYWTTSGTLVQPGTPIFTAAGDGWNSNGVYFITGSSGGTIYTNYTVRAQLFDLTKIYGYGNEPTSLEEFKKDFPDTYYKYTEGKQTAIRICDKPIYRGYLNQVYQVTDWITSTKDGITVSTDVNYQYITATGTVAKDTTAGYDHNIYIGGTCNLIQNHKYYVRLNGAKSCGMYLYQGWSTHPTAYSYGCIVTANGSVTNTNYITLRYDLYTTDGDVVDEYFYPEIIDLTALFGEGNEPTEPRICNELFGSNHVAYQTNTVIDSPLNLKAILQEQVTTKLVGYDTNTITGTGDITVSGTYNDPLICQYVPTSTTQATSTGANLIDIGTFCRVQTTGSTADKIDFRHLPDDTYKWTVIHRSSEEAENYIAGTFKDKYGNNITATAGQQVVISLVVDNYYKTATSNLFSSIMAKYEDGTYAYPAAIKFTPVGERQYSRLTLSQNVTEFKLYLEGDIPNGDYVIFHDFMFEIDTNVGTYEPYNHAQAGPSPANPLPVIYNQCQEITINPGITPTITSLEDTPKLIWAPTDYSTDFTYNIYNEGTRMRMYAGTDYVKLCPLVSSSSTSQDTAWGMNPTSTITLTAGKMYAFVFKYKRYNCTLRQLQPYVASEDAYDYRCVIMDSSGNYYSGTSTTEYVMLTHWWNSSYNYDLAYDEGWSWYRFTAPTTDNYIIRIGVDAPNTLSGDLSKESYIQITNVGIYEGTFDTPYVIVSEHNTVLNDDLERKLITNQQLGNVRQGATNIVPDTYSPYMDNEGTMQSCKIQRNIVKVFDGTESGWQKSSSHTHSFTFSLSAIDGFDENTIINYGWCSHFTKFTTNTEIDTKDGIYMYYTWAIYITQMDCTTLAEFKAWLANEAKTNPVVVVAGIANASDYKVTYGDPIKANLLPYQSIISHNGSSLTVNAKQYRDTRVPNGYIRLKYLQSNGTQYIDLGFVPTDTYGFRIHTTVLDDPSSVNALTIGVNASSTETDLIGRWGFHYGQGRIYIDWNDNVQHQTISAGDEFYASANYLNNRSTVVKDITTNTTTTIAVPSTLETTVSLNVLMFAAHWGASSVGHYSTAKVYECEITNGSTVIHHYLPCLDATNTPCMYDTITGTSYYNSGTGDDFTYEIL